MTLKHLSGLWWKAGFGRVKGQLETGSAYSSKQSCVPGYIKKNKIQEGTKGIMINDLDRQVKDVWNKVRDSLLRFETFSSSP